jgi:hypothetical protein
MERDYTIWTNDLDEILLKTVDDMRATGATMKKSVLLACEVLDEKHKMTSITFESAKSRYYYLRSDKGKKWGRTNNEETSLIINDEKEINLSDLFMEMRKVIKERNEYKAKYEESLQYKEQYEELKKKFTRIERETASLIGLIREKEFAPFKGDIK